MKKNVLWISVFFLVCILPVSIIIIVTVMDRIMSNFYEVPVWIRVVSGIVLLLLVSYGGKAMKSS